MHAGMRAAIQLAVALALVCGMHAEASAAQATLKWDYSASGAAGFALYWGKSSGSYSNRIDVGNTTTYTITGLTSGTTYYSVVVAYDARKVESAHSNEVRVTTPAATPTPVPVPSPSTLSPPVIGFAAAPLSGTAPLTVTFTNKTTGTGIVYSWNFGDSTSSTLLNPTHVYTAPGNYNVTLTATNSGGSRTLAQASYIKVAAPAPVVRAGLVAAYGFEEGTGTKVTDASGNNNAGVIMNAVWSAQGRFGKALSFSGNGWVTVNDAPSLNPVTGLTLEAWIYPSVSTADWVDVVMKEKSGGATYYLTASSQWGVPIGGVSINGERMVNGKGPLPAATWSHLATTYDGANQRLYVNGVLIATQALTGKIATAPGALRIGGDSIWGEHFRGLIDEVRVYNRALTIDEIKSDMTLPVARATP